MVSITFQRIVEKLLGLVDKLDHYFGSLFAFRCLLLAIFKNVFSFNPKHVEVRLMD